MMRAGASSALRASSSRLPIVSRPVARRALRTLPPALRQADRLPHGHVRPTRRVLRPATAAQDFEAEPFDPYLGAGPVVHLRPTYVPPDPDGVLQDSHAARELLAHDTLVIVRQLEMLNVFMGFEQANRYAIQTPEGELVGFLAEEEQSFVSTMTRQALRTHRPFRAVVMDRTGAPVLWIRRPFAFINSRIFVHASEEKDGKLVGEAQQEWHPWRRKYSIFQARHEDNFKQFARVDSGFLAWDFWLKDRDDRLVASINRNFRGLGREMFTDTGQYVIRFDSAGTELDMPAGSEVNVQGQSLILPSGREGGLTLDQRAMTLATAVSIDFDYFSRHSGSGGLGFPFFFWGSDGSSEAQRGGQGEAQPPVGPSDAGAAGAAGGAAAGTAAGMSEDEQIYGRQPDRQPAARDDAYPPQQEGMEGYDEQSGWGDEGDVLEDPWAQNDGEETGGGWFGGGGDWGGFGGDS